MKKRIENITELQKAIDKKENIVDAEGWTLTFTNATIEISTGDIVTELYIEKSDPEPELVCPFCGDLAEITKEAGVNIYFWECCNPACASVGPSCSTYQKAVESTRLVPELTDEEIAEGAERNCITKYDDRYQNFVQLYKDGFKAGMRNYREINRQKRK